jgi:hypothetical protein
MIANPHEIQRLRFTPGQDLLAQDFRDGETFEARLRHWHNRAIHQAYGVNFGLDVRKVTLDTTDAVEVRPGLAYDAKGRELALTTTRIVPFPGSQKQLLVLRRGSEILWIPEERLQTCDSVPFARTIDGKSLDPNFHPPAARPLARPRIGYGSTTTGGTAWQAKLLHKTVINNNTPIILLQVQVDTRAAGFTQPPCYFAWLQGRFLYPPPPIVLITAGASAEPAGLPPFLHPSIEEENLTGFQLGVLVVNPFISIPDDDVRKVVLARAQQSLSVCWIGIQMDRETTSSSGVHHGNP